MPTPNGQPEYNRRASRDVNAARWRIGLGLAFLVGFVLAGLFAPLPFDPTHPYPQYTLQGPGPRFWFGTDGSGLDVFSRTIAAAKTDIPLGILGALLGCVIGTPVGLLTSRESAGSMVVMRGLDIFQSLPIIIMAALITALAGGLVGMVIGIALINVPLFIRIVRSEALSVRSRRFIEAAEAMGASRIRIAFRHILPNVAGVIVAQLSLAVGIAVLVVAALTYLGIGLRPPSPSWGSMISQGAPTIQDGAWWTIVAPSIAICLTVLSTNVIADGVHRLLSEGHSHS